ncbi:hypothetical protein [Mastigocoleus sp. MO_188.B34]|uniref:photosystem II assembly protein Psb35 n=1 Tax=Mastigocoleus sp. MO_188.B34 TaxID=3036635 RepID=UPI0026297EA3|nr:hypothetical protein [Mastigocoleus sp. MO_188.B34]MDJ0694203.1 hypothetical protein [Mastigocoleus sp. MO_188.B34]
MSLLFNYIFAEISANPEGASTYTFSLTGVIFLGFIAAVTIGSIAWYNSKRPPGWENQERPNIVPKVEKQEHPGL